MSGFAFPHQVPALLDALRGVIPFDGDIGKRVKGLIALLDDRDRDLENYLTDTDRRLSATAGLPVGAIVMGGWATTDPPDGFLYCDGQAVSRADYAELFSWVGTSFGAGNGSTTFNVPDYRGRAPIGHGTGVGLSNRQVGVAVGSETVGAHEHTYAQVSSVISSDPGTGSAVLTILSLVDALTVNGPTGTAGNMQPSLPCKFAIKY